MEKRQNREETRKARGGIKMIIRSLINMLRIVMIVWQILLLSHNTI